MNRPTTLFLPVVGLVLCLEAGCYGPPPSFVDFNDKIARTNRKLIVKATELRKSLEPLNTGNNVDPGRIRPLLEAIKKMIDDTKYSFKYQSLPVRQSDSAPELLSSYQAFLDAEEKIYLDELCGIIPVLESTDSPKTKWAKIDAMFKKAAEIEKPALGKVRDAQGHLCKDHFLTAVRVR